MHREQEPTRRPRISSHQRFTNYYLENDPILHPDPGVSVPVSQLCEEDQIKIAVRMGLIANLPIFAFDDSKQEKLSECVICMCDYESGQFIRYLPCLHSFHQICIDDWLMRSLTCPSCLDNLELAYRSPIVSPLTRQHQGRQLAQRLEANQVTTLARQPDTNTDSHNSSLTSLAGTSTDSSSLSTSLPDQRPRRVKQEEMIYDPPSAFRDGDG